MTTDIKAWVDEHRAIHAAATERPWRETYAYSRCIESADGAIVVDSFNDGIGAGVIERQDTAAIVDAHNITVPTALSMIEAVLELHRPIPIYEMEAYCPDESDEHVESRHVECAEMGGEYYCADRLLAHECGNCRDEDGSGIEYPCPTVRALEGVIDGE